MFFWKQKLKLFFIKFLLPKFIEHCNRLLAGGVGDYSQVHGALGTLRVSLNNACTRSVRQRLRRSNGK